MKKEKWEAKFKFFLLEELSEYEASVYMRNLEDKLNKKTINQSTNDLFEVLNDKIIKYVKKII